MNLESTLATEGFRAGLSVSGRELVLLRTGQVFTGVLNPISPLEPSNMLLGSDLREDATLTVLRSGCPPILHSDRIMDAEAYYVPSAVPVDPAAPPDPANPLASAPALWKVVKRIDSPADIVVEFTLLKVTDRDA